MASLLIIPWGTCCVLEGVLQQSGSLSGIYVTFPGRLHNSFARRTPALPEKNRAYTKRGFSGGRTLLSTGKAAPSLLNEVRPCLHNAAPCYQAFWWYTVATTAKIPMHMLYYSSCIARARSALWGDDSQLKAWDCLHKMVAEALVHPTRGSNSAIRMEGFPSRIAILDTKLCSID